mgnify:CR=1 FL=1
MFNEQNLNSIQSGAGLTDPGKPSDLIGNILPYLFGIAGIVLLINIISSGFKMMTSKGDPKAMQVAQAKLTTSAIGILILFTSFWIVQLVMKFFGIDLILFS